MHTQTQPFYGPFSGTTRVSRCQKKSFWILWRKVRLTEADTPTIRLGATPSGLTKQWPPPAAPIFYRQDALPAAQRCFYCQKIMTKTGQQIASYY